MKTIKCVVLVLFAAALLNAQAQNRRSMGSGSKERPDTFGTRRCWSKGGIGIVNERLSISLNSTRNELILSRAEGKVERWKGKSAEKTEVVLFYDGGVQSLAEVPNHFDLSRSVVVSFEGGKIRYFDFQSGQGCYFDRSSN
jgi:hypothetical protein